MHGNKTNKAKSRKVSYKVTSFHVVFFFASFSFSFQTHADAEDSKKKKKDLSPQIF
jgi:hypothetical protein